MSYGALSESFDRDRQQLQLHVNFFQNRKPDNRIICKKDVQCYISLSFRRPLSLWLGWENEANDLFEICLENTASLDLRGFTLVYKLCTDWSSPCRPMFSLYVHKNISATNAKWPVLVAQFRKCIELPEQCTILQQTSNDLDCLKNVDITKKMTINIGFSDIIWTSSVCRIQENIRPYMTRVGLLVLNCCSAQAWWNCASSFDVFWSLNNFLRNVWSIKTCSYKINLLLTVCFTGYTTVLYFKLAQIGLK